MAPYSSAMTAKMKSVWASGNEVLIVPSPGPRPKNPPCAKDCNGAVHLTVVAECGVEKAVDAGLRRGGR